MSIQELFNKINPKMMENGLNKEFSDVETVSFNDNGEIKSDPFLKRAFLPLIVILLLSLAFGLGRLSNQTKVSPVTIEIDPTYSTSTQTYNNVPRVEAQTLPSDSINNVQVVGSVKSTKYHYLHCPGAKQISDANKITFANVSAAEAAGYTLALNCKIR